MALIHPVEALKDPLRVFFGDANAGIAYGQHRGAVRLGNADADRAVLAVIFDGIVAKIVDNSVEQCRHTGHHGRPSGKGQRHLCLLCCRLQNTHDLFCQCVEIHFLALGIPCPLVQVGQIDNIVHQRNHSLGLRVDTAGEFLRVLRFHHAVLQQLGITGDGMQRRFQLMGHIGGKLPPHLLSLFLFGDVKDQQGNPRHRPIGNHGAGVELIVNPVKLHGGFAMGAAFCLPQKLLQGKAVVEQQNVLSHAVFADGEQSGGRFVDAQDDALFVQQHHTLAHVIRRRFKFQLFALELSLLTFQLPLLAVHTVQKRL